MLATVLHLSTALPKPSAAALKPAAAQMDAALVTKLNSGGWKCARLSMSHPPSSTLSLCVSASRSLPRGSHPAAPSAPTPTGAPPALSLPRGSPPAAPSAHAHTHRGPTITELKAEAPFESGCAGWCDNHTTSWEWKCFWSAGVCTTCDECTEWNAPVGPRCEPWCAGHTNDWTTKCSWKSEVSDAALPLWP